MAEADDQLVTDLSALANRLDVLIEARGRVARVENLRFIEDAFRTKLGRTFRRQGRLFVASLDRIRDQFRESIARGTVDTLSEAVNPIWNPAFDEAALLTLRAFQVASDQAWRQAMTVGAAHTIGSLGVDMNFDLANPRAVNFLATRGGQFVTGINDTSRKQLANVLANGVEAGDSYKTIARDILNLFDGWSGDRADMIAITESAFAYTEGQLEMAAYLADSGVALELSWITAGDQHVCPVCIENEGASPIAFGDSFPSGDDGPPAHPSDRCDLSIDPVTG